MAVSEMILAAPNTICAEFDIRLKIQLVSLNSHRLEFLAVGLFETDQGDLSFGLGLDLPSQCLLGNVG